MPAAIEQLRFKTALWLWARWLPMLAWRRDLQSLIEAVEPRQRMSYPHLSPAYITKRVRRTTRRPVFMRDRPCLREGLLAYRFMRLAGLRPDLHFGVEPSSVANNHLRAHCWVVLEGATVLNALERDMVEVLVVRGARDGTAKLDAIAPDSTARKLSSADATPV